jgi:hypothetical protein
MPKRYAICVGINNYINAPSAKLSYAEADASAVCRILKDPTRGNFDEVIELLDEQATKEAIRQNMDLLLQNPRREPDDLVLIYFAGHGIRDNLGDLCLVPHDFSYHSDGSFVFSSMLHAKEIEVSVNNCRSKNIILIIDSCHSGALGRILGDIGTRMATNIFIIGATQSSEAAAESQQLQHGVFTECLLRAFNLSPLQGEWISLSQIVAFITEELKKFPTSQLFEVTSHFVNLNVPITRNHSFSTTSRSFTEEVKHIYELANYSVCPKPGWCSYPNLFIVEIVAGFTRTYSAVLCLDDRSQSLSVGSSHIELFLSLVRQLRADGAISEGMLVTAKGLPPELAGKIGEVGFVHCTTHKDLMKRVIDFNHYLVQLIDEFERPSAIRTDDPPLAQYYVELEAKTLDDQESKWSGSATEYITHWLSGSDSQRQLAILGEYGSGKTTLCRKLARDLAKTCLQGSPKVKQRIPIIIPLREFPKGQVDLDVFIAGHLAGRCKVSNPNIDAFKAMNDSGMLLLIFDGLDEMAVSVDEDVLMSNLGQIEQFALAPKSRVILTSRPEYFITAREENEAFQPQDSLMRRISYLRLSLLPFNEDQIISYLQDRITPNHETPRGWKFYYETIKRIHDLIDLSQRPVLLEMIIKTLPKLISQKANIDRPTLYKTYLEGEIQRQSIEKRRGLLIKRHDRFRMMQVLALYLYIQNAPGLSADLVQILVYDEFTPKQREELEAHTRDFLTCSFLIRRSDTYDFSHRSFIEYLSATALLQEIQKDAPADFGKRLLTTEVVDFLKELKPRAATLLKWIEATAYRGFESVKYLGSNAATVLARMGYDLSGKDFSGTVLRGADLTRSRLSESTFKKADLSFCDLTDAFVNNCEFEMTNLLKTKLVGVHGLRSRFIDIVFDHTDLSFANLSEATFRFCEARQADFGNVDVDNAHFQNSDFSGAENLSFSLGLGTDGIFGRWIKDNDQEYLELFPLFYEDRLRGVLYSKAFKVEFTGILEGDKYLLDGTEVAESTGKNRYVGVLSVGHMKTLELELWPDKRRSLPSFQGIFLPRD